MATILIIVKLNHFDLQAWLDNVFAGIADTPMTRLEQLLPWSWQEDTLNAQAA